MLEQQVESRLVKGIKKLGGVAFKFTSPGNSGVPDRLVVLPDGRVEFVELKTEVGKLSAIQERQIAKLKRLGARVHVLYGAEQVDAYLTSTERMIRILNELRG